MVEETLRRHAERWVLAVALIWLEVVFKASTTGSFWPQLLFVALFSVSAGLLCELATSFLPTTRANKIAKTTLMALAGGVFCVEYFVYRQFKLFYDVNTVVAGAQDAATGFGGQILALVFSPAGLLHVALFLAPAIAYGVKGTGEALGQQDDPFALRVRMARDVAVVHLLGLLAVSAIGTYARSYDDQYTFQAAVTNFGLVTGLRKDVQAIATGSGGQVSFTQPQDDAPVQESAPADGADATAQDGAESQPAAADAHPIADAEARPDGAKPQDAEAKPQAQPADAKPTFTKNALDIDFAALADTTSGTWAELDRYVATLAPSSQNAMTGRFAGFNLIFVSGEAFSAEAIRQDTTPTLWRMANKGIQFTDYYQFDSAGTTGGECANLFGLLPTEGGNSVKGTAGYNNYYTMGNALNRLGYNGWAFHNNTYTYYSRDLTHNNLGYSNGFMGYGNGMEQWVTWQWPQSDLEMVKGTFDNLYGNAKAEPFNVYYMSVSGHSGYLPGENAMSDLHAKEVADLPYSDPVKGYLACNIELDKAMEYLVAKLEEKGMAERTVIVIAADHFPYGLDDDGPLGSLPYTSELYGYDVQTYFERDHNRLVVWSASLEKEEPVVVSEPVGAIDVLPTLLNLFGVEWDSRLLPGRDVFGDKAPLVFNLEYDWKSDVGTYFAGTGEFVANEGAQVPDGYVEATNADVANRINYCRGVLTSDYYRHVFG